ncbi:MAG: NADH-quinone oxidoreductase subunit A [Candidatus Omnitrophota bacterium]
MSGWFFSPPIAFGIIFLAVALSSFLFKRLSYHGAKRPEASGRPYECGEDSYDHMAQPDYSQFFPFAFFFTIAHVATLMVTTVPKETIKVLFLALFYILSVIVGLSILFEREK